MPAPPAAIESKFVPEPNMGCWLWLACVDKDGYGRVRHQGRTWLAHALVYRLLRGEAEAGRNMRSRTHCRAGHAYDAANTMRVPARSRRRAQRRCMACQRRWHAESATRRGVR